jgi:hypothetical protein
MGDQQRQLQAMLEQLDAEIKRTRTVGVNQRRQLLALQEDVRALLERSPEVVPNDHEPNIQGLRTSLQYFEASHPILSSLIEQVLNTLSSLGI